MVPKELPRDAKSIDQILKSMGVDYEPRVLQQLLEFSHHTLQDSQTFAEHAERIEVDESDVRLAVEANSTNSFTGPVPLAVLRPIADKRNQVPLPIPSQIYGIRLPPERFTLTAQNFSVIPEPAGTKRRAEDTERAPKRPFEKEATPEEEMEPEQPVIPRAIGTSVQPTTVGVVDVDVDEDYD